MFAVIFDEEGVLVSLVTRRYRCYRPKLPLFFPYYYLIFQ